MNQTLEHQKPVSRHIVVMLGGPGAERQVSLRSGAAVAAALASLGHHVVTLDVEKPGWVLAPETELVFLALHGAYGEDGTVQDELDILGVPYTGCDAAASRVAFDKVATKERCVAAGVPTAPWLVYTSPDEPWPCGWHPPLVVKPVCQGSSVGLGFVREKEEWRPVLEEALRHDARVMIEEQIIGRETTVGILEGVPLPVVEVRPRNGSYDYTNKYTKGATDYFCPAEMSPEQTRRIQEAAMGAFHAIGGRDYGRVDVMVRGDGAPVVLEVNTLPGMTETSLLPKAAAAAGIGYEALCQKMADMALARTKEITYGMGQK